MSEPEENWMEEYADLGKPNIIPRLRKVLEHHKQRASLPTGLGKCSKCSKPLRGNAVYDDENAYCSNKCAGR